MRETEIVERIRQLAGAGHRNREVIKGIGDDCAIVRPGRSEDFVFTSDFVLEDRHFSLETHSAADVGHKALARSLSDLAAMGSEPVFCLVSLAVPSERDGRWIQSFYQGLLRLAGKYHVTLAGGDLAKFDKVVADVVCCGRVPRGKALLRSGAKSGDQIYVTGELGGAALGLGSGRGQALRRHLRPEPRIEAGIVLRRRGVSSAIDLSDGLSIDLRRLCLASGVGAELGPDIPVARGATLEQALHGGDDYELLFTGAPRSNVPNRVAGLAVTRIGMITEGPPGAVRFRGAQLEPRGWDHFG